MGFWTVFLCVCLLFISPSLCFIKVLKDESQRNVILSFYNIFKTEKVEAIFCIKMKPVFKIQLLLSAVFSEFLICFYRN